MSGWASGQVATGVGPVHYSADGSAGPAVVLLHSLGLDRASWWPTAEPLAAAGCRVIAVDLPGHGTSPGPRQLLTIEDYADVVAEVVLALELADVVLVGNSFGSIVAADAAVRFPHLFAGLVLVGCPGWPDRAARADWLHARSQVLLTPDGDAVVPTRDLVATMFPEVENGYVATVTAGFEQAGTWLRNVMWALYAYDSAGTFAAIPHPTLVVYGEHDWLQSTAPHILGRLPNGRQVTVPGGAHMTPINRPAALAAVLAEYALAVGTGMRT